MVSYKNTTRLFEIRSQLRKLQARLTDAEIELRGNIETSTSRHSEQDCQE